MLRRRLCLPPGNGEAGSYTVELCTLEFFHLKVVTQMSHAINMLGKSIDFYGKQKHNGEENRNPPSA